MARPGRPTIDLDPVKPFIYLQYCEKELSLLDVVKYLHKDHNIQVTTRTLTRRLQVWGFTKYASRIPATLLVTLQAQIVQLFYHHILTDEEIQRVLQGEGYEIISLRRLQMLRLSMGLSRRSVGGNFLKNDDEIKDILERELNVGSILHYARRRVYEHLRRQGYLIARCIKIIHCLSYV